ncbi:MAG: cobalamin-binding protein [Litorilituus sp.]|jgi:vitamin B12 transport system substrate-binding protein|nr:cobalamin-binding protein [Litorilituus sp.]
MKIIFIKPFKIFLSIGLVCLSLSSDGKTQIKPSIIALSPHIVEILYDIGAGEQIIGTTEFSDYPQQAKNIPVVGNYLRLQIEKVIALQPDLIFAWQNGNPSDDLARLKQLGFTIIYSQPNSFADIAKEMRKFGKITANAEQAEQKAQQFLTKLTAIQQKFQHKTAVTGFYELWSNPLTTVAKNSWPQQFLATCGVHNPFEQVATPYPQVNIETVLHTPIQLIIQPLSKNQTDKQGFNWQDWSVIPAVKNNQIIHPNADAMHRMTARSLGELQSLCTSIDETRQWLIHNKALN